MFKETWLALALLIMGGYRIISQQEPAGLKSPPNPHMANIDQTWQNKIVPQIIRQARPMTDLLMVLHVKKDFSSACKNLGYRSQEENPCIFCVQAEEKVSNPDTTSRSGRMITAGRSGNSIIVQINPTLRDTQLCDVFKNASYSDSDDQMLFDGYGWRTNEQVTKIIQPVQLKTGGSVHVYGVFSEQEVPRSIPVTVLTKIESVGKQ